MMRKWMLCLCVPAWERVCVQGGQRDGEAGTWAGCLRARVAPRGQGLDGQGSFRVCARERESGGGSLSLSVCGCVSGPAGLCWEDSVGGGEEGWGVMEEVH